MINHVCRRAVLPPETDKKRVFTVEVPDITLEELVNLVAIIKNKKQ